MIHVSKPAAAKIKKLRHYRVTLRHKTGRGFYVTVRRALRRRPNRHLQIGSGVEKALGTRTLDVVLKNGEFHTHLVRHSLRQKLVAAAKWGVPRESAIHYSEGPIRSQAITQPFTKLPLTTDCSGYVTRCYKEAGLPDPNGLGYKQLGYTGTLLSGAHEILTDVSKALPGDLIVYGPGTGWHVAMIVEAGKDPLTVSHGQESGPEYVRVSQDGRMPQRICRYI